MATFTLFDTLEKTGVKAHGVDLDVCAKRHYAASAPGVSNDVNDGVLVGDIWIDTSTPYIYQCTDNSAGAAVWQQIYPQGVSMPVLSKTGAYSVAAGDIRHLIDCTTGTFTVTLLAPATAGDGFLLAVRNSGTGVITVTDGTYSRNLLSGESVFLTTDGVSYLEVSDNGGRCTAWVNFNGTGTVAIRDSFNVSSITDNGVGDYTVNFTNAMANANYALAGCSFAVLDDTHGVQLQSASALTVSSARILTTMDTGAGSGGAVYDSDPITVAFFGGK